MVWSGIWARLQAGQHVDPADARTFFADLYQDSLVRTRARAGAAFANEFPTRQYRGPGGFDDRANGWRHRQPVGICDHFTADPAVTSTLRWFSSHAWPQANGTSKPAGASAALVVDLDGTPYCLIDFWNGRADWHEPQLNGLCVGIEHVSAGELRPQPDGRWTWWANQWTSPYGWADRLPPQRVDWRGARYMQPYSREQVVSNLVLKRAIVALYDGALWPELMVDHAMYRDDKHDMGPGWPLAELRTAAFMGGAADQLAFVGRHPAFGTSQPAAASPAGDPGTGPGWPTGLHEFADQHAAVLWTQLALGRLGRLVPADGQFSPAYVDAVRAFQQSEGLVADGIAGPKTRERLAARLARR